MKSTLKFLTSPFGKFLIFLVLMFFVFWGLQNIFKEKQNLKVHVNQAINEPLETVYNGVLSEILPERKQEEIEPSGKAIPSQINPQSAVPQRNIKKSEPVVFHSTRWQRNRDSELKPYVPPIGLYTAKL